MSEDLPNRSGEAELVRGAQEGDRRSFGLLIENCHPTAFAIARRYTTNVEDAADVVQEASMKAWRALNQFRGDSKFSTWYFSIVTREGIRHYNKQKDQRRGVENVGTDVFLRHGAESGQDPVYPSSIEAEIETFVKPLRDALRRAAQNPEIDAALNEHPREGHAARLAQCLRDALDGGLHDEARLLLTVTDAGLLGHDKTQDGLARWRRLIWAAAHLRRPENYPVSELDLAKAGMKAVKRFVDDYIAPFLEPPEENEAA